MPRYTRCNIESASDQRSKVAQETSERLLAAAEALILQSGAASVTTRAIGSAAGMNWALVSYHFAGLSGLLHQVLIDNVTRIAAGRDFRLTAAKELTNRRSRLAAVIAAFIDPLWQTPAAWNRGSAHAVVRELLSTLEPEIIRPAVKVINDSVEKIARELGDLVPGMTQNTVIRRLRLLNGTAEMMLPKVDQLGLYRLPDGDAQSEPALHEELLRMAMAAILAK